METTGTPETLSPLRDALAHRYAIERELGRGGMATVYLARDLKHGRHVAVKLLHPDLSAALGAERFLKEIELTASLQHPHILPLFDSGATDGRLWYVMPFVEGETLRARLGRERLLPIPEAVRIAREVSDALAYAHGRGVIHRDVKPENILLMDGHALVADFGIALAVQQAGGSRMTQTGLALGTPQYMAPEQAAGDRGVDARADLYALGTVLYEMLAGEAPFTGPTAQAVIARVLSDDPRPLAVVRPTVSPALDAIVATSLAKLPADRFPTAAAMREALQRDAVLETVTRTGERAGTRPRRRLPLVVAGLALAGGAGLGWWGHAQRAAMTAAPRRTTRFFIEPDSGVLDVDAPAAISDDGRTIVYSVTEPDGVVRLYARPVDSLVARPIPTTEDATDPFFSPDGTTIGFVRSGSLHKVHLDGSGAVELARLPSDLVTNGIHWMPGDTIEFVAGEGLLLKIPLSTGAVVRDTIRTTSRAGLPVMNFCRLPDGRLLLTLSADLREAPDGWTLELYDPRTRRLASLGSGINGQYANGHVVYAMRDGRLMVRDLDLDRSAWAGPPRQLAADVQTGRNQPAFALAPSGTLVWRVGYAVTPAAGRMIVVDETGKELRAFTTRSPWAPRISPDGRRLAYGAASSARESSDLWITDLADGSTQRVTDDSLDANDPVWSPDGGTLAYSAIGTDSTYKDVWRVRLDGSPARRGPNVTAYDLPSDWSPDGRFLLLTALTPPNAVAVGVWPVDSLTTRRLLGGSGRGGARFSRDGRWIAYASVETGRWQVYVQAWPSLDRKVLVSTRGGVHAVWAHDGHGLFYWQDDELVSVQLAPRGDGSLAVVSRRTLFRAPYLESAQPNYDVLPGDRQFVLITSRSRTNRMAVAVDALAPAK